MRQRIEPRMKTSDPLEQPCISKDGRHFLPVVFYRRRPQDLFIKSYWAECVRCNALAGPFPDPGIARMIVLMIESRP